MNKTIDLLRSVWDIVKWQFLKVLLILVTISFLPVKSLATLSMTVILYQMIFDLPNNPKPLKWLKMTVATLLIFIVMAMLIYFFGLMGALGIAVGGIIIMLGWVAYLIWQQWYLFDAVTSWGAERIRDKHDKDFDLEKVIRHGRKQRK